MIGISRKISWNSRRFVQAWSPALPLVVRRSSPITVSSPHIANLLCRALSLSPRLSSKKIQATTEGTVTTIEGVYESKTEATVVINTAQHASACPLCRLGLDIKYTDVLILDQFMSADGSVLPRYVSGLCMQQHVKLLETVRKAHKAGLLNNRKPEGFQTDPAKRWRWKKHNAWYNEHELHLPFYPRQSS